MTLTCENDYENLFISSVKKQGGHAFKIKMSSIGGLPDLCCFMPGYSPVLLEAKLIKDVGLKFKRTIHYSKLQVELLKNCNKVNSVLTAYGLIFIKDYDGKDACILMDPEVPTITHNDILSLEPGYIYIQRDKALDVNNLFKHIVPRLHTPSAKNVLEVSADRLYRVNKAG